ncbi:MAG: hypothetical protein JWQ27_1370 [Ferruginibacter sp.]|nr:hypothetical protein [Ferruginibacter sp.]
MSNHSTMPEGADPVLWQTARKRAGFKSHAFVYLIVNAFLWTTWYFSHDSINADRWEGNFPWPLFTTLGWGLGLAFHFAGVYLFSKEDAVQKEYNKLKSKQS